MLLIKICGWHQTFLKNHHAALITQFNQDKLKIILYAGNRPSHYRTLSIKIKSVILA